MAAIFRVKRRNEDEPLDALLVACKRRKTGPDETDTESASSLSKVVKFVGTVKNPDENVMDHISKNLSKEELKSNYKQHLVNITDKIRKETKESSAENRFKVINQFRSLNTSNTGDKNVEEVTVIDVEDTTSCAVEQKNPNKENYVYDLYYTTNDTEDFFVECIQHYSNFVSDSYRENGVFDSDHNDSEDSNSESHWKNDYPDSDHSENSILEDDMKYAVERLKINGEESDLSSEDEDFAYGVDEDDVDNYGLMYAKFKAKVMGEVEGDDDDSDVSEEDLDYIYD